VRNVARAEEEIARGEVDPLITDLERDLALEDVERLVLVVMNVQGRPGLTRVVDLDLRKRAAGTAGLDGEAAAPSFRMIDRRCRDAGFDPNVVYRVNDCQMAQALVAAGEGIALLPRIMLLATHPGVAIRPLATDPPMRRISAVRLSTRYLTPATERFTALLVVASKDHTPRHPNGTSGGTTPAIQHSPTCGAVYD
jgi:DNA-binding transcriptional LysR family regulator